MTKILPAIAGALAVGAAAVMKRSKSTARKAVRKGKKAPAAARSKITKKRASRASTKRKPARKH